MTTPPSKARGLLLDMDGVLWRGRQALPGVLPFFELLRRHGIRLQLVSNNATLSPQGVQARLADIGVQVDPEEVLTSSLAAAGYLAGRLPPASPVFAIGQDGLRTALADAGMTVRDTADGVLAVVVGMDFEVTWAKLAEAAYALKHAELFIGTNPDVSFPTERGLAPGNGAMLAALTAATGREPLVVGKPEPHLFEQGLARMGIDADEALAVGDRLDTDILGGQRAGISTVLLLSGVTRQEDLEGATIQPDWVYPGLEAFGTALAEGRA